MSPLDDREGRLMRVGLIADTHDRLPAVAELVRQMQAAGIGMILHAGDYCSPFSLKPFEETHMSLAGVFGKNDGDPQGLVSRAQSAFGAELFESPHSVEIGGRRLLIVHDIGDVNKRSSPHEIVIHGHTHRQEARPAARRSSSTPAKAAAGSTAHPRPILDLDLGTSSSSRCPRQNGNTDARH
jgi:putative phosphoesterase